MVGNSEINRSPDALHVPIFWHMFATMHSCTLVGGQKAALIIIIKIFGGRFDIKQPLLQGLQAIATIVNCVKLEAIKKGCLARCFWDNFENVSIKNCLKFQETFPVRKQWEQWYFPNHMATWQRFLEKIILLPIGPDEGQHQNFTIFYFRNWTWGFISPPILCEQISDAYRGVHLQKQNPHLLQRRQCKNGYLC